MQANPCYLPDVVLEGASVLSTQNGLFLRSTRQEAVGLGFCNHEAKKDKNVRFGQ